VEYSDTPEHQPCVKYVQSTWLKPGRVESLVQAWTNKHAHFGITVTLRLVKVTALYVDYIYFDLVLKVRMHYLNAILLAPRVIS
jgi:hypothetical protein